MFVSREKWVDQLKLEPPLFLKPENGEVTLYALGDSYLDKESRSIFSHDWPPAGWGSVLFCNPVDGRATRELVCYASWVPDLEVTGWEYNQFFHQPEIYLHPVYKLLMLAEAITTLEWSVPFQGCARLESVRVDRFKLEEETLPAGGWINTEVDPYSPLRPHTPWPILEEGSFRRTRGGVWVENGRTVYLTLDYDVDSDSLGYLEDRGQLIDPFYWPGDTDGDVEDLSIPYCLGSARKIKIGSARVIRF